MNEIRLSFEVRIALNQTGVHWVEEEAVKVAEVCGRCGSVLGRNGRGTRKIKTLIGEVVVDRVRLRCQECEEDVYLYIETYTEAIGLGHWERVTLG